MDDLVALLSAPAWSARVEVIPSGGGNAVGEVHVIAGGVSDAIHDGKSDHDALDNLRAVKGARFRIEPRLPSPADGDLSLAGPDQGKLEERPLATLMRYCEDYVLTSGIEVWRGNENAKVDYRRGEIVGVTVGGIDAPERLAEVMKWSSGRYKLIVPKLTLPETAPKAATLPAVVAPRATSAPSKTIFGMPALDPAAIALAGEKAKAAQVQARAALAPAQVHPSSPSMPAAAARAATGTTIPPTAPAVGAMGAQASAATPSVAHPPAAPRQSAGAKTIFGVQAPVIPSPVTTAAPVAAAIPPNVAAPVATPTATSGPGRQSSPAAPARPVATGSPAVTEGPRPSRTGTPSSQPQPVPAAAMRQAPASKGPGAEVDRVDRTLPTKSPKSRPNETPVWTYVGVGFVFGLALLGVYRLVMVLAH